MDCLIKALVLNKEAPVKKGENAGVAYYYLNDILVKSSTLVFNMRC